MKRKLFLLSLLSVLSYCIASAQYVTEKDFKRYELTRVINPNSGIASEPNRAWSGSLVGDKPYVIITNQYILFNSTAPSFQGYTYKYQFRGNYHGNLVYQKWIEPFYGNPGHWDESCTVTVSADLKTINHQLYDNDIYVFKLITSDKIGSMYE